MSIINHYSTPYRLFQRDIIYKSRTTRYTYWDECVDYENRCLQRWRYNYMPSTVAVNERYASVPNGSMYSGRFSDDQETTESVKEYNRYRGKRFQIKRGSYRTNPSNNSQPQTRK